MSRRMIPAAATSSKVVHYKWRVDNFLGKLNQYKEIHSPTFATGANKWALRLELNDEGLSFHLTLEPGSQNMVLASYTIGIGDITKIIPPPDDQWSFEPSVRMTGTPILMSYSKDAIDFFSKYKNKSSVCDNIVTIDQLMDKHKYVILRDGKCDIAVKVTIVALLKQCYKVDKTPAENRLHSDFGSMLGDDTCDVMIYSDDQGFSAHRAILCARSSVFRAMLQHKIKESNQNTVEIVDIEPSVLSLLLHYLYSGEIPENCELALKLFQASKKYDLPELKSMCEQQAIAQITIDNAVDMLIFADFHKAYELKKNALIFVKENTKDFISSPGYATLLNGQHTGLMDTIIQVLAGMEVIIAEPKPKITQIGLAENQDQMGADCGASLK